MCQREMSSLSILSEIMMLDVVWINDDPIKTNCECDETQNSTVNDELMKTDFMLHHVWADEQSWWLLASVYLISFSSFPRGKLTLPSSREKAVQYNAPLAYRNVLMSTWTGVSTHQCLFLHPRYRVSQKKVSQKLRLCFFVSLYNVQCRSLCDNGGSFHWTPSWCCFSHHFLSELSLSNERIIIVSWELWGSGVGCVTFHSVVLQISIQYNDSHKDSSQKEIVWVPLMWFSFISIIEESFWILLISVKHLPPKLDISWLFDFRKFMCKRNSDFDIRYMQEGLYKGCDTFWFWVIYLVWKFSF